MQKLAPRVSVVGWSLWLVFSLAFTMAYRSQTATVQSGFQSMIDLGVKGGGVVLSIVLCQRPHRALALMLAALCLFAFWRFYFGEILFHIHPQLDGLTFTASVADWWHRSTSTVVRFVAVIPFCVFVTASLVFWPFYALLFGQSHDNAA